MSQRDTFQEHFPRVTGREWLEKIRQDLRGIALEDTAWEVSPGLLVTPFAHRDDIGDFTSSLPFSGQWLICEHFVVDDAREANADILAALEGGCEALVLVVATIPDWEQLLDGVMLGLVDITLVPVEAQDPDLLQRDFAKYLSIRNPDPATRWVVRTVQTNGTSGITAVEVNMESDVILGLADAMLQARSVAPERVQFICKVGTRYFVEIARLRALRILFRNLQIAQGSVQPAGASIEGHCTVTTPRDYPYDAMMQYGVAALAAVCGGVERLVIAPPAHMRSPEQLHIARNVHHLLRYECRIEDIRDPVQGAYFIERLTRQITLQAWALMIERSEKDGR